MLEELIKDAEHLEKGFEALGFSNGLSILETAAEQEGFRKADNPYYRLFETKEMLDDAHRIRYTFSIVKHKADQPSSIQYIKATLSMPREGKKEVKPIEMHFSKGVNFKNEAQSLPNREEIISYFLDAYHFHIDKRELKKDAKMKSQFKKIGFSNYERLFDRAFQVDGGISVNPSVCVNRKIGSGIDGVEFFVQIKRDPATKSFHIESIGSSLNSPFAVFQDLEELQPNISFKPMKNGEFPSAKRMVYKVLEGVKTEFQKYVRAYTVSKDIKSVTQTRFSLRQRKG